MQVFEVGQEVEYFSEHSNKWVYAGKILHNTGKKVNEYAQHRYVVDFGATAHIFWESELRVAQDVGA